MIKLTDILSRIVVTFVAAMLLAGCVSCSSQDDSSGITEISYETPANIDNKMFSSSTATIPDTAKDVTTLFELDGKVCLIRKSFDNSDEEAHISIFNSDGTVDRKCDIECGKALSFCCHGDRLYCYTDNINGAVIEIDIYNWDGVLQEHNSISSQSIGPAMIIRDTESGNVICGTMGAAVIGEHGEVTCSVEYEEPMNLDGFFEADGSYYIVGRPLDAELATYYKIDLENGSCTRSVSWEELGGTLDSSFSIESPDYNGHIYDNEKGYIYRFDPGSRQATPVARIDNMLVQPPKNALTITNYLHILSDDLFCWYYPYDTGVSDLVIITPDDSLNLTDRTEIVVKGVDVANDDLLQYAAYVYNSTQDEYVVRIRDLGVKYTNASEAQAAILNVMTQFENGDTPDIFYGPLFDYQYWGDNGMVIDMSLYLEDVINGGKILPNIRKIMQGESGEVYQVFAGFNMWGFWGKISQYPDGVQNYTQMSDLVPLYSCDIADMIIRYHIRELHEEGRMLTEEELTDIIEFSIANGYGPDEQLGYIDMSDVGIGDYSLYLGYLSTPKQMREMARSFRDTPVFAGTPTVDVPIHMIYPWGQMAVSSSAEHPEACCDFISVILSEEVQNTVPFSSEIPVNSEVWNKYMGYMRNPDSIPMDSEDSGYILLAGIDPYNEDESDIGFEDDVLEVYMASVMKADTVMSFDWGLYNVITSEVNAYYNAGKPVDQIASSLESRIRLYVQENY
ncbi:hypothetical protein SAMN02910456_01375 [Ruminococcaceae bacterium YRB3002]|nr:hypothetical protein SAMN02910456_01375 [Ruminococcaceae bacterium YRB3002]